MSADILTKRNVKLVGKEIAAPMERQDDQTRESKRCIQFFSCAQRNFRIHRFRIHGGTLLIRTSDERGVCKEIDSSVSRIWKSFNLVDYQWMTSVSWVAHCCLVNLIVIVGSKFLLFPISYSLISKGIRTSIKVTSEEFLKRDPK